MRFAYFDEFGRVSEAHNDDTLSVLPDNAFELTEDQFNSRFDLLMKNGVLVHDPHIAPDLTIDQLAAAARLDRNSRLLLADTAINKAEDNGIDATHLRQYRQALRDVPEQAGFPTTINWPVMP